MSDTVSDTRYGWECDILHISSRGSTMILHLLASLLAVRQWTHLLVSAEIVWQSVKNRRSKVSDQSIAFGPTSTGSNALGGC